ncbi:hypothetical protein Intca_3116 [Intrasporangium calvum DSM 43043]|uniref:Uncharacterized protein n=1 Tax=Intrasporangium calvum (strain ATCC 23552 / DSM 43043 / JCM 3097 / NBRC 12989 / NCIMB 10167 / NRRL B-3866 / 7 KIP) TaxID=710696 RepID=E6SCJ8_INTC7|nr:hypothetical protein Intca_3116 [Intrasporangium calvum DSM 43043]
MGRKAAARRRTALVTCQRTRKVRFRDHRQAIEALHRAANARKWSLLRGATTRRREQRAYPCGHCKGWHLTSQPLRLDLQTEDDMSLNENSNWEVEKCVAS